MLLYHHSTRVILTILLLAGVAAAQKLFVVFFFDSVRTAQLHRRKLPLTYPDTNCLRMHAQFFCYFFDGQPLFWHKSSPLVPFVVSEATFFNIIESGIYCVNCINLTEW